MLVSLTLIPGKGMEQIILGNISKHMKDKKVTGSQQRFMKGKSYLPRLIAFYGKVVEVDLNEGRTTDGVCVDFSEAFDTASHRFSSTNRGRTD